MPANTHGGGHPHGTPEHHAGAPSASEASAGAEAETARSQGLSMSHVIHPARAEGFCTVVTHNAEYDLKVDEYYKVLRAMKTNLSLVEVEGLLEEDILLIPQDVSSMRRVTKETLCRIKETNDEYQNLNVIYGD